jgi:hypothetical protein
MEVATPLVGGMEFSIVIPLDALGEVEIGHPMLDDPLMPNIE